MNTAEEEETVVVTLRLTRDEWRDLEDALFARAVDVAYQQTAYITNPWIRERCDDIRLEVMRQVHEQKPKW